MTVTADDLIQYLRLPPDTPGNEMELFIGAAMGELEAAGVAEADHADEPLYKFAVIAFAAFAYDNRGLSASGSYQQATIDNAERMKNSLILQLRNAPVEVKSDG